MSIVINLFGNGIRCWICEIPIHRYNQLKDVADFNKTSLNNVIFDLEILKNLGYYHWKNIFPIKEIIGFNIEGNNKIEIKQNVKTLSKFTSKDIFNEQALFKLYSTKEIDLEFTKKANYKYILIGQTEIGSYKYKVKKEPFTIEKLCFSYCQGINNKSYMIEINYEGNQLLPIKNDTIIRSFFINYLNFE
ncbi:hypothetical protein FRY74_06190 [Vicingus serpentipes]|uniref:Uncharacterized protein n=1 Tax=Vicingus serpentipes TaxID=1926625 RepID=A0A5C6RWC1_9FLAO|nr:hypothetical protein [Vicingus serpentipes]TXB66159.1 hypothetical protein FRY74_06190 [Vicingus serpentipes]